MRGASRWPIPKSSGNGGFSAYELASRGHQEDDFPPEVRAVLETEPQFAGVELLIGIPELKVPLRGGTAASQNDLWALARSRQGLVSIAVEGKVAENFDVTLGDWLASKSEGRAERWQFLCLTLGLAQDCDPLLRYQLVHHTASAVRQAERFGARSAVLLVHSFSPVCQRAALAPEYDTWLLGSLGMNSRLSCPLSMAALRQSL